MFVSTIQYAGGTKFPEFNDMPRAAVAEAVDFWLEDRQGRGLQSEYATALDDGSRTDLDVNPR